MAKQGAGLTDAAVRNAGPGRHHDGRGHGLFLDVKPSGARAWVQRVRVGTRVREVGHGPYPTVSLVEARKAAQVTFDEAQAGIDPVLKRRGQEQAKAEAQERALRAAMDEYIKAHAPAWKNPRTATIFRQSLEARAASLLDRPVAEVDLEDVRAMLAAFWNTHPVLAQKVRGRLQHVFEYASAAGWRRGANPAMWAGGLRPLLPKTGSIHTTRHHPALHHGRVGAFLAALRRQDGLAAKALHLAVLTACRSGEARGADWSEIDIQAATWVIPAARMKAKNAHRIPLSGPAVALLRGMLPPGGVKPATGLIFPSPRGGAFSDMALLACVMRAHDAALENGEPGWVDENGARITPHGFRTSFRSWCGDTGQPRELAEMALAHRIGSAVEQAYSRSDLLERRRVLMQAWADYISAPALHVVEAAS